MPWIPNSEMGTSSAFCRIACRSFWVMTWPASWSGSDLEYGPLRIDEGGDGLRRSRTCKGQSRRLDDVERGKSDDYGLTFIATGEQHDGNTGSAGQLEERANADDHRWLGAVRVPRAWDELILAARTEGAACRREVAWASCVLYTPSGSETRSSTITTSKGPPLGPLPLFVTVSVFPSADTLYRPATST